MAKIRNWKIWLIVMAAILVMGEGAGWLLILQGAPGVGAGVRLAGAAAAAAWLIVGLFRFGQTRWVRRVRAVVVVLALGYVVAELCLALGSTAGAIATAGALTMGLTFYLGLLAARAALSPGWAITGVARTLVDEAIRMKLPLVFIVGLMLLVPALPFAIDPHGRLQYRIQSFLSWSIMSTGALLSLMTLFLAISTVTREINQRQIFLTMTKPVGRATYLAGKWLGIALLDAVLVAVCFAGIATFTQMLRAQPAVSAADRAAVEQQVMTARSSVPPKPAKDADLKQRYDARLAKLRADNPQRYGPPGSPENRVTAADRAAIQQRVIARWYTLGSSQSTTYRFTGLGPARRLAKNVQLRLKPDTAATTPRGFIYLVLRINGRLYVDPNLTDPTGRIKLAANNYHVLDLPTSIIDQAGVMSIQILNPPLGPDTPQPTISFNPTDGLEVLYPVGGFTMNLARSAGIIWVRLCFLAVLGLTASTFLGFPVACLLCGLVLFTAAFSSYLGEAFKFYAAFPRHDLTPFWQMVGLPAGVIDKFAHGDGWGGFKMIVRAIGSGFTYLVPSFGAYNPTALVADGRAVPWSRLGGALLWIGVIWSGALGLVGYFIFRRRELAQVTV